MVIPLKLAAAKYLVGTKVAPYLASVVFSLLPVPKPGLGTIGCDQFWRLYYDPETIEKWPTLELAGALVHECWHLVLRHHKRGVELVGPELAMLNKMLLNISFDCEINDGLRAAGIKLPSFVSQKTGEVKYGCHPADYDLPEDKLGEWYFWELSKKAIKIEVMMVGSGNCGSCAHGTKMPWEDGEPSEGSPGISKTEGKLIVQSTISDMARRGDVPANFKRWAEVAVQPRVDPKLLIARAIRSGLGDVAGMVDYTYSRVSRRSKDVIMPALIRPTPRVAIVADTSGSMDQTQLGLVVGWTAGILQALGYRQGVPFLATDAKVHTQKAIWSPKQIELRGGGGTDMRLGIAAANQVRPRPDLIVVLTDAETPWHPVRPPGLTGEVLVVVINQNSEAVLGVPRWMRRVQVQNCVF